MEELLEDKRDDERLLLKGGIVRTPGGLCQVIDLSPRGLLLKSFKKLDLPDSWALDIYDTSGLSLEQLPVRKIWQKCFWSDGPLATSLLVGVEFEELLPLQKAVLNSYLLKMGDDLPRCNA